MSGAKGPVLLIAGGCAAMAGAAALAVSLGSFFVDLPTTPANAAVVADLPVKKVKTVALTKTAPEASRQPRAASQKPVMQEAPHATVAAAEPAEDALNHSDPRWARNAAIPKGSPGANDKLEAAFAAQEQRSSAGAAATAEMGKTGEPLSMLGSVDGETELQPTVDELPTRAPRREDADDDEPRGGKAATINRGVNLRASPRSGSRVLGTVPSGARIALASDCLTWCRITYDGRTGYVWRDYVSGGARASKPRTRRTAARQVEQQAAQPTGSGLFGNPGTINNDGTPGSARARAGAAQAAAAAATKTPEKPAFQPPDR